MPQDTTGSAEGAEIMRMLAGAWVARIINVAAELGVADAIGEDAQSSDAIAVSTETYPPSIARLLRALAAIGVLNEHSNSHYSKPHSEWFSGVTTHAHFVLGRELSCAMRPCTLGKKCFTVFAPARMHLSTYSDAILGHIALVIRSIRRSSMRRCKR